MKNDIIKSNFLLGIISFLAASLLAATENSTDSNSADRPILYKQKKNDAPILLKKMFLHEEEICDRQLGEKIFDETAKLQQTENDALFGDDRHSTLQKLTEYLRNFNYAIGKEQIERTRAHVEKTLAEQTRNKEQIAKLSRVQLEQGGNGPFVINKGASQHYWRLVVIRGENRQDVQQLLNLAKDFNSFDNFDFRIKRLIEWGNAKEFEKLRPGTYSLRNLDSHLFLLAIQANYINGDIIVTTSCIEYIPGESSNYWKIK